MDVSCIPESDCCCLFVYFLIFLSLQFSNIKNFVALLSGMVSPRKLKLGTHNGWMYRVYRNQATAAAYSSLFSFFFLSNFQRLKFFITDAFFNVFMHSCPHNKLAKVNIYGTSFLCPSFDGYSLAQIVFEISC